MSSYTKGGDSILIEVNGMLYTSDKVKVTFSGKTFYLRELNSARGLKKLIFEPEADNCDIIAEISDTFELVTLKVGSISVGHNLLI